MSLGADVVDADGDLTVGLLAQGAAILPLHADGVLALLGESGVVEDEDALGAGEGLRQVWAVALAEPLLVPGALVDELLQGLLGVLDRQIGGQDNASGQRLDALAFAVVEQPLEVEGAVGGLGLMTEVLAEELGVLLEACE